MRLIFQGWRIALKHSARAMLSIILCLALLMVATAVALRAAPTPEPVKIGIINHDNSAAPAALISSVLTSHLEGVATVTQLSLQQSTDGFAAVITLPQGFWDSIMAGENLSPELFINAASPLEGLWVTLLAQSAGRTLVGAQHAVGGMLSAMYAQGVSEQQLDRKLLTANLSLMESYLNRKGVFESETLHATGNVTPTEYYGGSAVSFVLFSLLFLLYPPLYALRQFALFSQRRAETFIACLLAAATLFALLCPLCVFLLAAAFRVSVGSLVLLLLLCASLLTLCAAVFKSAASCAASVTGLALIQALLGGGLLPEALLPARLLPLCRLLPLSLMRRLCLDAAVGAGFSDIAAVLLWCAFCAAAALALWTQKREVG